MDAGTPFSSSITGILLVYVGSTQQIVESAGRVQFVTVVFEHDAGFGRPYAIETRSLPARGRRQLSLGTSLTFE
jgi:hypothetical protein